MFDSSIPGWQLGYILHIEDLKKQQNIFINESIKHFLNGSIYAKHFTYYFIHHMHFCHLNIYPLIHQFMYYILNVLNIHISILV